jgi:uncharacterized membrane protein
MGALVHAACAAPAQRADGGETSSPITDARLPCAPGAVLQRVCQRCHGPEPSSGASISFVVYEDVHARINGRPLYAIMAEALERRIMPPETVTLADEDRETLLTWLKAGAPPRAPGEACSGGVE